jgi:hypothetical protein
MMCQFPSGRTTRLLITAAILMTVSLGAAAATITVTVNQTPSTTWLVGSFGPGDITAPGDDFAASTQTGPNPTVTINISGTSGNSPHTVYISKTDGTTWNSAYTLWVYPLSTGSGPGTCSFDISGWTQVTSTETALFAVRQDRSNVTVQLRLQGLSAAAGTSTSTPSFTTTVNYRYQ